IHSSHPPGAFAVVSHGYNDFDGGGNHLGPTCRWVLAFSAPRRWASVEHTTSGTKRVIIGMGTDIVEIERIAAMIERHGDLFVDRIFTPAESAYCGSKKHAAQHFAGRWAAKEAAMKAIGTGFIPG